MGFSAFRAVGLTHYEEANAFRGYTVYSLLNGPAAYLIDMRGEIVHTWKLPEPEWRMHGCELLPNGNLLVLCITKGEARPGGAGAILELDWSGKEVWRYEDPGLHHAAARRANGNTMVIRWEKVPQEVANAVQVANGKPPSTRSMFGDAIIEVDPAGKIVWEWHSYLALDPVIDRGCALHKFDEWTHANAFGEFPNGDFAVCFRLTDTIAIVNRETGKFRWRWGAGVLGHPHDVTVLDDGKLMVFDNGFHVEANLDRSCVRVIDPATATQAQGHGDDARLVPFGPRSYEGWTYAADPAAQFFSAHLGSAQRLPNGNTLISEGSTGRLFEVTLEGAIVWEFVTPFHCPFREDRKSVRIMKARRYALDSPHVRRLGVA